MKVIVLHKGGTVGRGVASYNITIFYRQKIGHRKKKYGETSISTVPRGCACQLFESILHNCKVRLAFPLYLRCPFLNGFCTHPQQSTYATTNYVQSSSEVTASCPACLPHVEKCHPNYPNFVSQGISDRTGSNFYPSRWLSG